MDEIRIKMDFLNNSVSLPNGIWSSRAQTLQSLSDDLLHAIREQSRASLHNPSPQSYSKVTINGREYSVTYHPQDDLFAVERINGCQGRFVQWLYNMIGHPRGQITWQLTYQLNSPNSQRNYRVAGAALLPGGDSTSANNRPTVSEARTPPVSPTPSLQATPSPSSPAGWAEKLTDAVIRQKIGEPLTAADLDFSNADFRNIKFSEVLPPSFLEPNGDIIKGFNFSNSKFTNSDMSDLHFDECKFSYSSFAVTNCSNTIFSNSDMSEMTLTPLFSRQQPPSFTNSTLKNSFINCGIKLSGVILNKPDNASPRPSIGYAMRLGDTWLSAPLQWNEGSLDVHLNHEHNDGNSLLMTIDSLPGKYSQEKVRAMEE
ncbi:pentapeptide repeat-containing protein, partial [Salmonella enterica]|nr:pentapeptide repeat-containing protein [Salmonella enterica]